MTLRSLTTALSLTLRKTSSGAALVGLALLAGCATTPPWPDTTAINAPAQQPSYLLEQVPFYPQERFQCGPAALATVLNSQGLTTEPDILKELVYLPGRQGSMQVEMVAAARSHDMVVYPLEPDIEAILEEVAAGHPVLVMQNLRFNWWPQWHFAVIVGYDIPDETLILNTDTRKHYRVPYKAFDATWARAQRWARVILPPDTLPATANMLPYLRSAHDLETTGHTRAARQAYGTAQSRWPDHPAPAMALGNLAFARNAPQTATEHFLGVVEQFPDFADGWNNLGFALAANACPENARAAMSCAAGLAPDRFSENEQDLPAPSSRSTGQCPKLPACPTPER